MKKWSRAGFTLIELLTVIAIIAILASMSMVVGPRLIERAKIISTMKTCDTLKAQFFLYATKNAVQTKTSFPPGYGYRNRGVPEGVADGLRFHLYPYMKSVDLFRKFDYYDRFSQSSCDTDRDGKISLLEFSPLGHQGPDGAYVFEPTLYNGANLPDEVSRQLKAQRPLAYIPVNSDQFKKAEQYWRYRVAATSGRLLEGANALRWLPNESFVPDSNPLADLNGKFPPSKYDDFVLISVGPGNNTGHILTPPQSFLNDLQAVQPGDRYYILALRAFFLATRDMSDNEENPGVDTEGNGKWDFDYRNRTRGVDGKATSYKDPKLALLPDGTAGQGPLIYQCNAAGY